MIAWRRAATVYGSAGTSRHALAKGERWQVEGRLRPPWGNLNPGGFDYERWLLGQGMAGTGYVRDGDSACSPAAQAPEPASRYAGVPARWLEGRGTRTRAHHAGADERAMTPALSQADWRSLRDSGTVHLLVVSGLHVGMVSGFLYLLGRLLARLFDRLLLHGSGARRLAGSVCPGRQRCLRLVEWSGVPAVRAWLMSALVLLAMIAAVPLVRALNVVLLVMALVLIGNPLVVHQQGFWLVFCCRTCSGCLVRTSAEPQLRNGG